MDSKRLSLRRETLTEIGPAQLALLAGGYPTDYCTMYSCTCPESHSCPLTYTCVHVPPVVVTTSCTGCF